MKTLATVLSAVILSFSLSSCGFSLLTGKYQRNEAAASGYLAEKKTAPAAMNIEGLWYSPQWGIVVLNQEKGGKITGVFQDFYSVRGVVTGKKAYLVLTDDDWAEYTVELQRKNWEELSGYYSSDVPFSEKNKNEVVLKRIDF